ncbi:hypothetical protein [Reyranella sp.]|uniref:hypothetical protein n=1 Tax=Reyranella sp. TaxID=1929291 RepID=UPI003D125741
MKMTAGVSLFAAVLAIGASLPERQASAQVRPVPREGVAFNNVVTQRVKIESADPESRTVAFTMPNGQLEILPVAESVKNLDAIDDGSMADVTYSEVVTMLNLRQKGPGAQLARKDQMGQPNQTDVEAGRFTLTVVGVDLAKNMVSVIDGRGGPVRTYSANSIAKQDMLKKIKVGDVVIGMTTPLTITAISPAR